MKILNRKYELNKNLWRKRFAFLPTKTIDGWVWFGYYYNYFGPDKYFGYKSSLRRQSKCGHGGCDLDDVDRASSDSAKSPMPDITSYVNENARNSRA
jgi:hypothetical protein